MSNKNILILLVLAYAIWAIGKNSMTPWSTPKPLSALPRRVPIPMPQSDLDVFNRGGYKAEPGYHPGYGEETPGTIIGGR